MSEITDEQLEDLKLPEATMSEITDEQLEDLKDAFTLFDKVGDDKVDSKQIICLLQSLGLNPLTEDIGKVIKDSGLEGQRIDFPTFVSIYEQFLKRPSIANNADIMEMFRCFDRDNSKQVFGGEFRQILINLGDKMSEEEINHFLNPHENEEGYIPYEKLIKYVLSK